MELAGIIKNRDVLEDLRHIEITDNFDLDSKKDAKGVILRVSCMCYKIKKDVFIGVSITVKRHRDHGNSHKGKTFNWG